MLKISDKVLNALKENKPVVALETTIISHGMPYPENINTALAVEKVIEDNGAIPATIGIIDGVAIIGMNHEEIKQFGLRKDIKKVSRRDLSYVYSNHLWGATTVAATMILAKQAGIEVFVTGGIGGVHRHAQETFDISADLEELAKTDVTVVCAGCKSILDLNLTMEYLETKGVPVFGFKTHELPAFYTSKSGIYLEYSLDDYSQAAKVIKEQRDNNIYNGILITNPILKEDEMDPQLIESIIQKAIVKADSLSIKGKDITPYLLKNIVEMTDGASLKANIALILNNAKVGANIAKEYAKIK